MMAKGRTLLVDLGNTRIKWAWLSAAGRPGRMHAAAHAHWSNRDFREALQRLKRGDRVLAVSVAADSVRRRFAAAVRANCGALPQFVESAKAWNGVQSGYREPLRLGADRWVAMLGARTVGRDVLVIDVGTAVTIDLLDADGRHRGGAILPGSALMVASLLAGTGGISRRVTPGSLRRRSLFARSTREAVEAGARHALIASIHHAVNEAALALGSRPRVLLTGGGASELRAALRVRYLWRPALVLEGLAMFASGESDRRRYDR